jgi:hypothetical protein
MKGLGVTIFLVFFLFQFFEINAQITYSEGFDDAADVGAGMNPGLVNPADNNWTLIQNGSPDITGAGDHCIVTGGVLQWRDNASNNFTNSVTWSSGLINTAAINIAVSVDYSVAGASAGNAGLRFQYSIDGGAFLNVIADQVTTTTLSGTATISGLTCTTSFELRVTGHTGNAGSAINFIDNISITGIGSCSAPTIEPANPTFTGVTTNSTTVNWASNGDGDNVLVVAKLNSSVLSMPTSGTSYTANTVFGSGTQIGTGNYVLYDGSGSSVSVTGLITGSSYDYYIYAYNASGDCYYLVNYGEGSQSTVCTPPVTQASTLSFASVAKTSMDISWVNGSGTAVLVVAKLSSTTHVDPSVGVSYTANASFGSGDQIGTGNYVVYNGVGNTFSMTGFTSNTDYDISIYSYFSASDCYNLTELSGTQSTLAGANYTGLGDVEFEIDVYNGDTITGCTGWFTDSNPSTTGNYGDNEDYTVTFCSGSGDPMTFDFDVVAAAHFDALASGDTLYLYGENGELLMKIDGTDDPSFTEFHLSTVSQCVTFRFVSDGASNDDGWRARIACEAPPADCNGNQSASDIALQAPYICNFDGYCGSTSSYYHEDLPGNMIGTGSSCPSAQAFVGTVQNNSWLRFVAGATTVSMDFTVSGCGSDGIQVAILGVSGNDWTRYSDCSLSDGGNNGTFTLTGTGMTIGEVYYIMADGNSGANCDYTIDVDDSDGFITVDAGSDQVVCSGDPVNLSVSGLPGATYTWNSLDGVVNNVTGENQVFNPNVATTYVVEVTGGGICESRTDTVVVDMCVVLSVDLLGFSAECKESFTQLNWQTASEINNEYFEVEKSIDGIVFESIGYVSGSGNSNIINNYSLQDFELVSEQAYYRLKQVDFDGVISYSNLVALDVCGESVYEIIDVYYDGASNIQISYNIGASERAFVSIVDVRGRMVQGDDIVLYQNKGKISWLIDSGLSSGLYFVKILSGSTLDTKKILISK